MAKKAFLSKSASMQVPRGTARARRRANMPLFKEQQKALNAVEKASTVNIFWASGVVWKDCQPAKYTAPA